MQASATHWKPSWQVLGLSLVLLMALLQAFYAGWAFLDPLGLARFRGTPDIDAADVAWLHAYGSRTLFIALVVALLWIKKDTANLKWVALLGLFMPLSDGLSALRADLPAAYLYRQIGIALYLLFTFAVLVRASRAAASAGRRRLV